jgi:cytoskeletal protein CcmA (bactofilin family)
MFNKGNRSDFMNSEKVDTLIGHSTTLEGTIKAEGTVRVNGNITGELIITGNVIIGDASSIKGNIKAENAYVAGTVQGNITATGHLHMTSTAKILGDIWVKNVIIDEGAIFNGHCKSMSEDGFCEKEKENIA